MFSRVFVFFCRLSSESLGPNLLAFYFGLTGWLLLRFFVQARLGKTILVWRKIGLRLSTRFPCWNSKARDFWGWKLFGKADLGQYYIASLIAGFLIRSSFQLSGFRCLQCALPFHSQAASWKSHTRCSGPPSRSAISWSIYRKRWASTQPLGAHELVLFNAMSTWKMAGSKLREIDWFHFGYVILIAHSSHWLWAKVRKTGHKILKRLGKSSWRRWVVRRCYKGFRITWFCLRWFFIWGLS